MCISQNLKVKICSRRGAHISTVGLFKLCSHNTPTSFPRGYMNKDIDLIPCPPGPSQVQMDLTKVSSYTVVALRHELCYIFFTSHSVPADQYLWLQFRNYGLYFQFYMEKCLWQSLLLNKSRYYVS